MVPLIIVLVRRWILIGLINHLVHDLEVNAYHSFDSFQVFRIIVKLTIVAIWVHSRALAFLLIDEDKEEKLNEHDSKEYKDGRGQQDQDKTVHDVEVLEDENFAIFGGNGRLCIAIVATFGIIACS